MTTYRTGADAAPGYRLAIQVLRGVAARSGSDAARWAADYLEADPDRHLTHGTAEPCPEPGVHALDGDAPPGPLSAPVSAQEPPVGGNGRLEGVETLSGGCDCGHEGLPAEWHSRPCPLARVRVAGRLVPPSVGPGCICNDPPPTVDKPKNGTASRPDGWACPRHGTVI